MFVAFFFLNTPGAVREGTKPRGRLPPPSPADTHPVLSLQRAGHGAPRSTGPAGRRVLQPPGGNFSPGRGRGEGCRYLMPPLGSWAGSPRLAACPRGFIRLPPRRQRRLPRRPRSLAGAAGREGGAAAGRRRGRAGGGQRAVPALSPTAALGGKAPFPARV